MAGPFAFAHKRYKTRFFVALQRPAWCDARMQTDNSSEYFTKAEAAKYVRMSARTLDAAKAQGALPYYRIGSRKVLFRKSDLDKWLAPCRVDAGGAR